MILAAASLQVTAGLASHEVNALTELSFFGKVYGDVGGVPATIAAGDCFEITRPIPYKASLRVWQNGG